MRDRLTKLFDEASKALEDAIKESQIAQIKTEFLGRKGKITALLRGLSDIPPEKRPAIGRLANEIKTSLEEKIRVSLVSIKARQKQERLAEERLDVTLPGRKLPIGNKHPITEICNEIVDIFLGLGFQIIEGPEIESDYYNFEALNIPKEHPARDMHDTFYISDEVLLRTHTSPVQIRVMEKQRPPIQIIAPGKAFRCDSDVSHTPMFHQVEGLMVANNITFGDLKGVLTIFVQQMFGEKTRLRFRPSFFPFTEPSAEVDIQCVICQGQGCRLCSSSGWLEILGSGMVDPEVFRVVGYNPAEITGFAFGMGIERIAMLKYGISDIRLFFENDMRFLGQF
ncbi:MAG: phenylalanine--tRNA ligase subunit alpha [Thermodesulfobacteriota bacterium]|nr:phenylalanine--tRNA ligase subunit alpha [Thermodesulfobacteriota bacterium]